ncbi:hypothetical protein niasHT_017481 [Heterodera trifolii]|uniref:Uncharacterized protein n=1 Tax=Heterodera trifolii TaxID=157864 RepID=A0ABD2LF83_9BILA
MVKRTTFEWQEVKIIKPIWMRRHSELEKSDDSFTNKMPPTAGAFQIQNLAFSSGTMKNLRERKKIGSSETGKKNGLMKIWRFDKYSVKVAGQIIVESAKWLKTWIFIKIPDKILLDYHI